LDYIPHVSTYSNLTDIVAKIALAIFAKCSHSTYEKIESNPIIKHLNQKSYSLCIFLAVPWLNIFVAFSRDFGSNLQNIQVESKKSAADDFVSEMNRRRAVLQREEDKANENLKKRLIEENEKIDEHCRIIDENILSSKKQFNEKRDQILAEFKESTENLQKEISECSNSESDQQKRKRIEDNLIHAEKCRDRAIESYARLLEISISAYNNTRDCFIRSKNKIS
jgi:hypothetical protein